MTRQNKFGTWVFCAGVFDLLHYGHIRYLNFARSQGDVLVVGLLTDEAVKRYKPHYPVMSYQERWEVVKGIRGVDYVVKQEDTDPTDTLKQLKKEHNWIFDIMVRADDYKDVPPGTKFIEEHYGKVVRAPYCNEISSSLIKNRIAKGWNG